MKMTAAASLAVAFFVSLSATTTASACGDKLLYLNRIYRHHSSANITIALFSHPNSLLENAAALNLARPFEQEGYHLLLVNSDRDLALALQSGAADVVIVDTADLASIQQLASDAKVPIIPVTSKTGFSKAEAKHYPATITAPLKASKFLDALDRAFDSRQLRALQAKSQTPRVSSR